MPITTVGSNTTAATHFRRRTNTTYLYRRFGSKPGRPLLFPEHFTGHARQLGLAATDLSHRDATSSCSITQALAGQPATSPGPSPGRRHKRWISWIAGGWTLATSWASRLVE
jgi:hypothetical protein